MQHHCNRRLQGWRRGIRTSAHAPADCRPQTAVQFYLYPTPAIPSRRAQPAPNTSAPCLSEISSRALFLFWGSKGSEATPRKTADGPSTLAPLHTLVGFFCSLPPESNVPRPVLPAGIESLVPTCWEKNKGRSVDTSRGPLFIILLPRDYYLAVGSG